MHMTTRRQQQRWYFKNLWRQLQTMGSAAPVGGGGGADRGLRVDAVATAGGGWRRRGKAVKAAVAAEGGLS
jgi:hypothetical protein